VISRRVSQKYYWFYTYKTSCILVKSVKGTSIQLTEFINEISTKIIDDVVYTKKVRKLLGQTMYTSYCASKLRRVINFAKKI